MREDEFDAAALGVGQIRLVEVDGNRIAVFNADCVYYATEDRCPHTGWPLSDGGELIGTQVTCPMHGWCFNVADGSVVRGIKTLALKTYRVSIEGMIGRVELDS